MTTLQILLTVQYIYIKKNNFIQPTATQREGKTTRYSHYIQA